MSASIFSALLSYRDACSSGSWRAFRGLCEHCVRLTAFHLAMLFEEDKLRTRDVETAIATSA